MNWHRIRDSVRELAVQVAWTQWASLGSSARPTEPSRRPLIIDPEALILLSLRLQAEERRLTDLLRWWAHTGTALTSLQRIRTLAGDLPEDDQARLGQFARWASSAGHKTWAKYAHERGDDEPPPRQLKGPDELWLSNAGTLMLRMRAAFGVGAKSDVLTFLIGLRGDQVTVSAISRAVSYTETAVRSVVKEMAMARLIHETSDRPALYRTPHRPWAELLELHASGDGPEPVGPGWGMWSAIFAFLAGTDELTRRVAAEELSPYVASSRARDLIERHRHAFEFHDIPIPRADAYPGVEYATVIQKVVEATEDRLMSTVTA